MNIHFEEIQTCVDAIRRGDCIAYPTEAVWGLGCDPKNPEAVQEILRIKSRPVEKGLILIAAEMAHFDFLLAGLPTAMLEKMKARWPGHVTWLVPHKERVPPYICGDSSKVAIRVSAHSVVQALGHSFGSPIVSTSANPAGQEAARNLAEARDYFSEEPLTYAPGEVGGEARPSTIIDAETGHILRS